VGPGEWTDDTSMAVAIAEVAAAGGDLCFELAQDAVVRRWYEWSQTAPDVGVQTRAVLDDAWLTAQRGGRDQVGATDARRAAEVHHRRSGRSGGNGSLMRTAPVALAFLGDEPGICRAARDLSALTHFDPEAGDACVLWSLAIGHAVLTGALDPRRGLIHLPSDRRTLWEARISEAERRTPAAFQHNGWVVEAFQGAWSAITMTSSQIGDETADDRRDHLALGLDAAVRGGRDTDTVAAIAGGLLGGAYGASAVPAHWRDLLHGWPGLTAVDLTDLAAATL
jgi:ADP-ribosyl-[dinitrogen reductase] hydrolase